MDSQTEKAVKILSEGGIVIFPTDTVFGIGCRMDRRDAVERLFMLRKRPVTQATPLLVSSIQMACGYFKNPNDTVIRLMESYWPGALTIVAPCDTQNVHEMVRGHTETVGLRMPNHTELLEVISRVGVPILGPSANFHGDKTPFLCDDVKDELIQLVDYVLPGECHVMKPSTVVSVTDDTVSVIREGAIHIQ